MAEEAKKDEKKKGGKGKLIAIIGGGVAMIAAGIGGGLYAASSGMIGGGGHAAPAEDPNMPKLVVKGEPDPTAAAGEGGEGGAAAAEPRGGGPGGEKYESNYYQIEKEFTANLRDSPHFVQVGLAVATNYDSRVIQNVKHHSLPIRSAVLLALADADEESVFTSQGKAELAKHLKVAINKVLEEKEGFGGIGNVYFTNFIVQ